MSGTEFTTEQKPAQVDYRRASWTFRFLYLVIGALLRLLFKIEIKGRENLPREGGYIFAGNHLSWIDPFLMLMVAPPSPKVYFIAAREVVEEPAWRKFLLSHAGGIIPVDREKKGNMLDLARQVHEVIKGGGVLGIFPEGDVSAIETGKVLPFKKGIGFFASQTGAPVVPVAFRGTKELWLRKRICMVVGEPIPGHKGGKLVSQQQMNATAQAILALMPPPPAQNPRSRQFMKKFFTELFTTEDRDHPVPD